MKPIDYIIQGIKKGTAEALLKDGDEDVIVVETQNQNVVEILVAAFNYRPEYKGLQIIQYVQPTPHGTVALVLHPDYITAVKKHKPIRLNINTL